MHLIRAKADTADWHAIHRLIAQSFAYMEPRLGHPAQATLISPADLAAESLNGPVFLMIENKVPVACLFCRPSRDHPNALYIGKLAVAETCRGKGLARKLVEAAADEAQSRGFVALTLDTGDTFADLHRTFQKLGFGPPEPRPGEPRVVKLLRWLSPGS